MVHLFDIWDTFRIEGRGLVIVVYVEPSCAEFRIGDKVEFRPASGQRIQTSIKAIEMINVRPRPDDGRAPVGLMVTNELPSEACEKGAEIWKVDQQSVI